MDGESALTPLCRIQPFRMRIRAPTMIIINLVLPIRIQESKTRPAQIQPLIRNNQIIGQEILMDVGVDVEVALVGAVGAEDLAVVVHDLEDGAGRHGWVARFAAALEEAEGGDGDEEGEGVVAFTLGLAEACFGFDDADAGAGVG